MKNLKHKKSDANDSSNDDDDNDEDDDDKKSSGNFPFLKYFLKNILI